MISLGLPALSSFSSPSSFNIFPTFEPAGFGTGAGITNSFTKGRDMDWGAAGSGALQGGTAGSAGGPIGAGIGAGVGFLQGLLSPSKTATGSGMPSLTDALTLGMGSLFGGGKGGATPLQVSQSQSNNQMTSVNVTNILGGQPFAGGVSADGSFDTLQALSDVFKIRDAMAAASVSGASGISGGAPVSSVQSSGSNMMPIILIAGAVGAAFLIFRKGK